MFFNMLVILNMFFHTIFIYAHEVFTKSFKTLGVLNPIKFNELGHITNYLIAFVKSFPILCDNSIRHDLTLENAF
jgi:hypothetical protein